MLRWGELECITDVTHHQAKHLISTSLCAVSALCLGLGSRSVCEAFVCVCLCLVTVKCSCGHSPWGKVSITVQAVSDWAQLRPSSLLRSPQYLPWGPSMSRDTTCTQHTHTCTHTLIQITVTLTLL